jgi:hypothetical protein
VTASVGVLAACTGSRTDTGTGTPTEQPNGTETRTTMGKVCPTEKVGDFAVPQVAPPTRLGEIEFKSGTPPIPPTEPSPPNQAAPKN